jgi:toxin ParE1/3/4
MTKRIAIRPRADRDLDQHFAYIAKHNSSAAERFLLAAKETLGRLAAMPELGGTWGFADPRLAEIRVWQISGFENYLVFYRPVESGIEVVRILHGARDIGAIFDREE